MSKYVLKLPAVFAFCLLLLTACNIKLPTDPALAAKLPERFRQKLDSTSIAFVPRNEFFKDSVLVGLIDSAMANNLDLKKAMQRVEMARAGLRSSRGRFLPQLDFVAAAGLDKFGTYTMNGVGNFDTNLSPNVNGTERTIPAPATDYILGFKSSWEINLWGAYKNLKKAANARFLASAQGRLMVTTSLVAEVASLYYEMLALDYELVTIQDNIKLQQRALEIVLIMKEGGRSNELAVKQFQGQLLNTQGLEVLKRQQIIEVESQLNFLLGRFPQAIERGGSIRSQNVATQLTIGSPALVLQRRPDIQMASLHLAAAKGDVKAALAAFFPGLNVAGYAGLNSFKPTLLMNTPASLAAGLLGGMVMPIMNRNLIRASFQQASAAQLEAYYQYHETILRSVQEVNVHMNGIGTYASAFSIKEEEVSSLQQAVSVSNELFQGGQASYLEVITAQKSVLQAQLESTEAKKHQFLSLIELYRSLGGGWE